MPSSISNSDERLRENPVAIRWTHIVAFTLCLVGVIEIGLRIAGREAPYLDTMELWAENRAAANNAGVDAIAILGTSRAQMDIHPQTLESHFPGQRAIMLANVGKSPMGLLENLAADPDFTGTVICDISMHWILPELWDDYDEYNAYFENTWPREQYMNRVRTLLRSSVAISHGNSFADLLAMLEGRTTKSYLELQRDRFKRGYFENIGDEINEHRARFLTAEYGYYGGNEVPSPEELDATFERAQAAVLRLQERGCRVIFVRLPTSGGLWAFQQDIYNDAIYWDRFAEMTTAETYHFQDYPELADFKCPDWSHLNYDDALKFTDALGALLSTNPHADSP